MTTTFQGKKPLAVRSAAGDFYLMDYPAADPAYASEALYVQGVTGVFFTDFATAAYRALQTGCVPYALLNASGIEPKLDMEKVTQDVDNGTARVVGQYGKEIIIKATITDLTPNKLSNILGAASGDLITTAPGASIGGGDLIVGGHQKTPNFYRAMWRTRSPIVSPSSTTEYDFWIFPRLSLILKGAPKWNQKGTQDLEVEMHAESDIFTWTGAPSGGPTFLNRLITAAASS